MIWMSFVLGCTNKEVVPIRDSALLDCSDISYANVGEPFMTQYCIGCHGMQSSNRHGAPNEVTLDSIENIQMHVEVVHAEVASGTMPPGGGVASESVELVLQWLDCEALR